MSLWTPDGEHQVPRDTPASSAAPQQEAAPATPPGDGPAGMPGMPNLEDLSPEERAQVEAMAAEMAEVRQQLLAAPASTVVANHAMGLYELAAIHLSAESPKLEEARLAIDGLGALVEASVGRLGEAEPTLTQALSQIRMVFVQMLDEAGAPGAEEDSSAS